jgi:hypothetical protein
MGKGVYWPVQTGRPDLLSAPAHRRFRRRTFLLGMTAFHVYRPCQAEVLSRLDAPDNVCCTSLCSNSRSSTTVASRSATMTLTETRRIAVRQRHLELLALLIGGIAWRDGL